MDVPEQVDDVLLELQRQGGSDDGKFTRILGAPEFMSSEVFAYLRRLIHKACDTPQTKHVIALFITLQRMMKSKVFTGQLEILIDEQRKVTSAVLDAPVYPSFDEELLRMAKTWKFRPATRSGVPITYVKGVQIQLQRNR